MSKIKRAISSDIEEITKISTQDSQRLKPNVPALKPSESVECLSDNIVLLEVEVRVRI